MSTSPSGSHFPTNSEFVHVRVKSIDSQIYRLQLNPYAEIRTLKRLLEIQYGIPYGSQRLLFHGRVLEDQLSLQQCCIEDDCTILLVKLNPVSTTTTTAPIPIPIPIPTPSDLQSYAMASTSSSSPSQAAMLLRDHFQRSTSERGSGRGRGRGRVCLRGREVVVQQQIPRNPNPNPNVNVNSNPEHLECFGDSDADSDELLLPMTPLSPRRNRRNRRCRSRRKRDKRSGKSSGSGSPRAAAACADAPEYYARPYSRRLAQARRRQQRNSSIMSDISSEMSCSSASGSSCSSSECSDNSFDDLDRLIDQKDRERAKSVSSGVVEDCGIGFDGLHDGFDGLEGDVYDQCRRFSDMSDCSSTSTISSVASVAGSETSGEGMIRYEVGRGDRDVVANRNRRSSDNDPNPMRRVRDSLARDTRRGGRQTTHSHSHSDSSDLDLEVVGDGFLTNDEDDSLSMWSESTIVSTTSTIFEIEIYDDDYATREVARLVQEGMDMDKETDEKKFFEEDLEEEEEEVERPGITFFFHLLVVLSLWFVAVFPQTAVATYLGYWATLVLVGVLNLVLGIQCLCIEVGTHSIDYFYEEEQQEIEEEEVVVVEQVAVLVD